MSFLKSKSFTIFTLSALVLVSAFLAPQKASAADPKLNIQHETVAAKFVSQSIKDPITIEAGKTQTVILKFKNIGTETWKTEGRGSISAYTMEPRDRKSLFYSSNWISAKQTGPIAKITKPNETVDLSIVLKAPEKTGDYMEEFYLASENYSWVKGGYFFLKIKVVPATIKEPAEEKVEEIAVSTTTAFSANKFIQSPKNVSAVGGEKIKLTIGFQNTGKTAWKKYSIVAGQPMALASASTRLSFADELWKSKNLVLEKEDVVDPGEFVRETVYFRTPSEEGEYTAKFYLQVEDQKLEGVYAEIPVTVTSNAPDYYREPFADSNTEQVNSVPVTYRLDSEPRIRVGLWQPETYVQFRSYEDEYDVYTGTEKQGTLGINQLAILMRKDGQYYFRGGDLEFSSDKYIRLSPVNNPHAVFNLLNYRRYVKWKGPNNFNMYRGAMEFRLGEVKTDAIWVINDLLFEDYVEGISENSNLSAPEYLRAQSVAQRSYAYATIHNDKYGIFDVVATTGDQLYMGVESERIMPNFVKAVKDTRGYMAVYDNKVVITPYYAHAACRTKSWTEKWGGTTKPWLVSVKTNYDCKYYSFILGHGVGMSQLDAARRAEAENLGWRDLVKYYYTGVALEKIYE